MTGIESSKTGPAGAAGAKGDKGDTGATGATGTFTPQNNNTITGNISGGSAIPIGLTIAQVLTLLGTDALYQPLDSDLTAIAALSTTAYGRAFLALANAAAAATAIDSNTTPSTQAVADAATVGTIGTLARGDHKHAWPSAAALLTSLGLAVSPPIPPGFFIGPLSTLRTLLTLGTTARARGGTWLWIEAESQPIDQMIWEVTTGGDNACVISVGLYRPRAASSLTLDRVAQSSSVSATGAAIKTATVSATLARGLHLAVMEASAFTSTVPIVRATNGSAMGLYTDTTDATSDPRGGVHTLALDNFANLPTSGALVTTGGRSHAPIVSLRGA